jgi:hypothetical protein
MGQLLSERTLDPCYKKLSRTIPTTVSCSQAIQACCHYLGQNLGPKNRRSQKALKWHFLEPTFQVACTHVNARVILRRNNFDPPSSTSFSLSTVDALQSSLSRLFGHTADRCGHPTLRQVVSTWTRCGKRLAPRRANEGYTAEPSALARLVCQAYHRRPGRTTCRPPCLNSLTPGAHRAGPLHPRCAVGCFCPTPATFAPG